MGSRSAFPDRICLPPKFDVARLAAELEALQPEWTRHFVQDNYEGDWSAWPLRAPAGETHPIRMIGSGPQFTEFVDTADLDRMPYVRQILAWFRCPLRSVRLMRLAPGSVIKEHNDPGADVEGTMVRMHVPIVTNDAVEFMVNRRPVEMAPGSLWYLRLADPHSAANRGTSDRVHLVIDAVVNPWLRRQLALAAGITPSASRPDRECPSS